PDPLQRLLKHKQIIHVPPTLPHALPDHPRHARWLPLYFVAQELRVAWEADVDHAGHGFARAVLVIRGINVVLVLVVGEVRMKRREMRRVAIDLALVEVSLDLFRVGGGDVVCSTPDAVVCFAGAAVLVVPLEHTDLFRGVEDAHSTYLVGKRLPERPLDDRHDAAGGLRGPAVVCAVGVRG
ncbi:hypothetical protein KEM55_003727, partial [Ascosphaera atra]